MSMPPLLSFDNEAAYRTHFEAIYCKGPIVTFDGITVRFKKTDFDHCCFESNRRTRQKQYFSLKRAERLDWIQATLKDPGADLRVGWDNTRGRYDRDRRVAVVSGNYIVIIALQDCRSKARFITAYVADTGRTLQLIKTSPRWPRKMA